MCDCKYPRTGPSRGPRARGGLRRTLRPIAEGHTITQRRRPSPRPRPRHRVGQHPGRIGASVNRVHAPSVPSFWWTSVLRAREAVTDLSAPPLPVTAFLCRHEMRRHGRHRQHGAAARTVTASPSRRGQATDSGRHRAITTTSAPASAPRRHAAQMRENDPGNAVDGFIEIDPAQ
jgi:hypothetical protein